MRNRGFTLIELLIVVAIIGILAGVVVRGIRGISCDKNYVVNTGEGRYCVESYSKENQGQCVYLSEHEVRFCGDWSVEKLGEE